MNSAQEPDNNLLLDEVFTSPGRQQWVELTLAGLNRQASDELALQELRVSTIEGIPIELLYDSYASAPFVPQENLQLQQWNNRVSVSCQHPKNASRNILRALGGGVTSVEIHTLNPADLATVLSQVELDVAPVSLRAGQNYAACAQAFKGICGKQKIPDEKLTFSANADPVSTALTSGHSKSALTNELEDAVKFTKLLAAQHPCARSMLVDSALHHNAGASTVEELHASLATATLYLEAMLDAGMPAPLASAQIVFQLAMDTDVLLGIAKLRALRALWHQVLAHFSIDSHLAAPVIIVAETSRRFHSRLEPWNNHLRNLCASKAAMLGNADTLIVHPHDSLLRTTDSGFDDTDTGDRMARNMAIILERECGLLKVKDPMAGSYAIENLTQQLMQHTWESLGSTDTSEGWMTELLSGQWQSRLQKTHQLRIQYMREEKNITVGVNRFGHTDDSNHTTPIKTATDLTPHADDASKPGMAQVRDAEAFEQSISMGEHS